MKLEFKFLILSVLIFLSVIPNFKQVQATSDPRDSPNNKVGVGILSPETDIDEAAQMVNNNGDWGWVVIVIKKSERNLDRWQSVFSLFNKNHLTPIVRIATDFDQGGFWQKPANGDSDDWADFLSKLYWPTKNKYVQVYNEVNRANEWGGSVDPEGYAKELEKTAGSLRSKSTDFFVLNSPLDLAADSSDSSLDAELFLKRMNNAVPGIFNKIDGWASHSYPNPDFSAGPIGAGRLGISGYLWELSQIQKLGAGNLPIFITETGWKRSSSLDENLIANYYKTAFEKVWNDKNIVAVCPFIFDYPESLFQAFSFKTNGSVLGRKFYNYYGTIRDLSKDQGRPDRDDLASDFIVKIPTIIIKGFPEEGNIALKNTGNYVWSVHKGFGIKPVSKNIKFNTITWEKEEIYPGETAKAHFIIDGDILGKSDINLNIADDNKLLAQENMTVKNEDLLTWFFELVKAL